MSDVFFTADTHFGHRAMIERGWRPQYASVAEMDADLIERWNATVRPGDVVWHLGDFGLGGEAHFLPILEQLHGIVHLIAGNHDHVWPGNRQAHKHQPKWFEAGFASIQPFARRRIAGQNVMLSHFPYYGDHVEGPDRAWQYRLHDDGLRLLHGHVHSEWATKWHQFNVGVDVRDFRPVPIATIEAWLG